MNNNQPESKTFEQCPVCGSTARFVADIAREQGLDHPEMYGINCIPGQRGNKGMVSTKIKMEAALIGSETPMFGVFLDACSDCGCVYTFSQEVVFIKKPLNIARQMPQRQQGNRPVPNPFAPKPGQDPFKLPPGLFNKG